MMEVPVMDDPLVGRVLLGRYRVVRRLAKGGMGVVYLARTEGAAGFVKPVVIKRIIPASDEGELVGMFVREARILSHLRHPNIAGIVDFAEEGGAHLMVLEYVHGFDLLQWRRYVRQQSEAFDAEVALHICICVLDALAHAHRIEHPDGSVVTVVHRDVSLSNVLIDTEGHVKLIDFGIARIQGGDSGLYKTTTAMVKGKIPFLAPELLSGIAPTPATDVYSCAVLLHDLLLGKNELKGTGLAETVRRVIGHTPSAPSTLRDDVPPALDAILAKALSKNPAVRFKSADELASALREVTTMTPHEVRARLLEQIREDYAAMPAALELEPLEDRERSLRTPLGDLPKPDLDEGDTSFDERPTETRERRAGSRMWLIGGIALVVALVVGVAIAFYYMGKLPESTEQVFIVQEPEAAAEDRSPETPDIAEEPTVIADAGPTLEAPIEPRAPSPAPPAPRRGFAASFARHRPEVEACLVSHAANIEGSPELAVRFVIEMDGSVREARVLPAALASTPLGACLLDVAQGVQFAPQDREGIAFTIPIRVEQR